jgi:cyclase
MLLDAGADKVTVNSAALRRPALLEEIAQHFGNQVLVCAIDARRDDDGQWYCYLNGGRERTDKRLYDWAAEAVGRGAGEILFTSMNHDGARQGFANDALAQLADALPVPVIASGGAGTMQHFYDAFCEGHADAALAASLFHFKEIEIQALKDFLTEKGITMREVMR